MAANLTVEGPQGGVAFCGSTQALTNAAIQTNHMLAGNEIFDNTSDLTMNAAGATIGTHGMIFTAPVTGKYWLGIWLEITELPADHSYWRIILYTSNRSWLTFQSTGRAAAGDGGCISVVADLDASDIATPYYYQSAGTASTDIVAGQTAFSGFLIG
jgi:hypothetical protein